LEELLMCSPLQPHKNKVWLWLMVSPFWSNSKNLSSHTYCIDVACKHKTSLSDWKDDWNHVLEVGDSATNKQSHFPDYRDARLASKLLAVASLTEQHLLLHVLSFPFCALFRILGKLFLTFHYLSVTVNNGSFLGP
jgi:hypothetical protein